MTDRITILETRFTTTAQAVLARLVQLSPETDIKVDGCKITVPVDCHNALALAESADRIYNEGVGTC
jgi:hypothetical protein